MLQVSLMMLSGWNSACAAASHQQGPLQPLLLPLLCLFKPPLPLHCCSSLSGLHMTFDI